VDARARNSRQRNVRRTSLLRQEASERLVIGADDVTKMAIAMIRAEVRDRTPTVGERRLPFLPSTWF